MSIADQIKQKIEESFHPDHLELINESHKHRGHAGDDGSGESHFKLIIVSAAFEGVGRVQRHRMVYKALEDFVGKRIHALSVVASSPSEV